MLNKRLKVKIFSLLLILYYSSYAMENVLQQDEICNQLGGRKKLRAKKKLKTDGADYKYKCDKCGKRYAQKSHLDFHVIKKHEKIKQYICVDCGKTFYRDEDLKSHAVVHTGEKSLKCTDCSKTFGHRQTRDEHNLRVHRKIKSFICLVCDEATIFYTLKELKKHSGKIHPNALLTCCFCPKSFSEQYTQVKHQEICPEKVTKRLND